MKYDQKLFRILAITMFLLIIFSHYSIYSLKADITPIIPVETTETQFEPSIVGNSSYLIVEPDFIGGSSVFHAKTGASVDYTENNGDTLTANLNNPIGDGDMLPPNSLVADVRNSANPFFASQSLPRFVNITTAPINLTSSFFSPISLHIGHSFTFFFNSSLQYLVIVNGSDPFLLDISIMNPSSIIYADFTTTLYPGEASGLSGFDPLYPFFGNDPFGGTGETTLPVFPDKSNQQNITMFSTVDSLVTLTLHPLSTDQIKSTEIPNNQVFSDKIEQGQCFNLEENPLVNPDQNLLDMHLFSFPVTTDTVYQINFYNDDIYQTIDTNRCGNGELDFALVDKQDKINFKEGDLNSGQITIQPAINDTINFLMIARGTVYKEITFYITELKGYQVPKLLTLEKNKNITILEDTYYKFSLSEPALFAINRSSVQGGGFFTNFEWFKFDSEQVSVQNFENGNSFTIPGLFIEVDNLYGDTIGDLDVNWIYIPTGSYGFVVTGNRIDEVEFTFNFVTVQSLSGEKDLLMDESKIYALELSLVKNHINFVNLSTSAHDNLSITYEYSLVEKYSEIAGTSTGNVNLGNKQDLGEWIEYDLNETTIINDFLPTRDYFVPILLIRPFNALFLNDSGSELSINKFSTTLTVSSNAPENYFPSINRVLENKGFGFFIPIDIAVTSQASYSVNDDLVVQQDAMVYGIPLQVNENSLYNVTVILSGNYSSTPGDLNASLVNVFVHGGNFIDIEVLSSKYSLFTNTTEIVEQTILTVSPMSYLYVDLIRNNPNLGPGADPYLNAKLTVIIQEIPVKPLESPNLLELFKWNETASPLEIADTTPLWNVSDYSYSLSGDLLVPLIIGGLVGGGVLLVAGIVVVRKRRGSL